MYYTYTLYMYLAEWQLKKLGCLSFVRTGQPDLGQTNHCDYEIDFFEEF